jgi:hypothetical protein
MKTFAVCGLFSVMTFGVSTAGTGRAAERVAVVSEPQALKASEGDNVATGSTQATGGPCDDPIHHQFDFWLGDWQEITTLKPRGEFYTRGVWTPQADGTIRNVGYLSRVKAAFHLH